MLSLNDITNGKFIIENISIPEIEVKALELIGIYKDMEILVLRNGYLEGSKIIKVNDNIIQLNPYFTKNIYGSIVKEKVLTK